MKFALLCLFCFIYADVSANSMTVRAAIDIGMGGPKLQVAEVDLESNKIIKTLHTQRYFVNFYDSIDQSSSRELSLETMEKGLDAVKNAIKTAHFFDTNGIVAIATASFRSASNGMEFAEIIEKETGVKVHVIDQDLEGRLAFQAALAKTETGAENLIVWDIGGGSIQLVSQGVDGEYLVDSGKEGVGAFNDYIIKNIQSRDPKECKTPNPMSSEDILQAITYARNLSCKVDPAFKAKISQPQTRVVGVGNAFGYGIASMIGKDLFCLEDSAAATCHLAGKTDVDLGGGDFAFCEGSNVLLAYGFMLGLNISHVQVLHINNADGAIIYKPFWN